MALPSTLYHQEWSLPSEAFQPRHEIEESTQPLDPLSENTKGESPSSANDSEFSSTANHQLSSAAQNSIKQEILGAAAFTSQMPSWHFTSIVCDMLHCYAERVRGMESVVTVMQHWGAGIKYNLAGFTKWELVSS